MSHSRPLARGGSHCQRNGAGRAAGPGAARALALSVPTQSAKVALRAPPAVPFLVYHRMCQVFDTLSVFM